MLVETRWFSLLALASFFVLAAPPGQSQCGPDGLDAGLCCTPTGVALPQFPAMMQDVRWLCFDGCQTASNVGYCANIGQPIPVQSGGALICGAYNIRIRLRVCGTTNFVWLGFVNAFYSRNWQASSQAGAVNLNVWRFIINGDFLPTALLPNSPCDRPGCLATYSRVYFSGHIDYALDCNTNTWQVAFSLNHECDGIHHMPGTSRPAPLAGSHPTRSFSIVGPGSTFTPITTSPTRSDGPITQQAIRRNNFGIVPSVCSMEERARGSFVAQNEFCFCFTPGANQYVATQVSANGVCGSAVLPSAVGVFLQKRIGLWNSATVYPGTQTLLFDVGYLTNVNGCNGTTTQEWFEGAETVRGFSAFDFAGIALDPEFEDLGSSNNSYTNPAIRIGAPHVSNIILNFNLP